MAGFDGAREGQDKGQWNGPRRGFQFDWSGELLFVGYIYYRMQVSQLKPCASREFWLVSYASQGHEMLFDAHTRWFAALAGVARRGIYDNMRAAIDKIHKGSRPHNVGFHPWLTIQAARWLSSTLARTPNALKVGDQNCGIAQMLIRHRATNQRLAH